MEKNTQVMKTSVSIADIIKLLIQYGLMEDEDAELTEEERKWKRILK